MEATVDPQPRGPDWMPITPKTGSLFHADSHDSLEAQKKLLFLPGQLTDGIEPSDDPLIGLRDGAYAVSFSRRNP